MEMQHADWINWFSKCILEEAEERSQIFESARRYCIRTNKAKNKMTQKE